MASCGLARTPDASEANAKARTEAWARLKQILSR
jgi:hypothetical protein